MDLEILTGLCDLPTAPYLEACVIAWLTAWARGHRGKIRLRRDRAGNVYLEYRHGLGSGGKRASGGSRPPLVFEAHMDHPGFEVVKQRRDGRIEAVFRGGVKPSHFKGARVRIWVPDLLGGAKAEDGTAVGEWISTRVLSVKSVPKQRHLKVMLAAPPKKQRVAPGSIGMWDLPDAVSKGNLFAARVCDDLAGLAAIICTLEELIRTRARTYVIALCSRAEEVGFAGVLAACENQWVPKGSPVIGLETSRAFPDSPQGAGPIIRVGDRTGIFSAGLTHFITQAAGHLSDADSSFKVQRKLMDGGTCSSTAFAAYGYDSAGICLALGNYHNMFDRAFIGKHAPFRAPVAKAGPGIASETIHLGDFAGLVRLLVEVARRISDYKPGLGPVRKRLSKMHREEQKKLLYRQILN